MPKNRCPEARLSTLSTKAWILGFGFILGTLISRGTPSSTLAANLDNVLRQFESSYRSVKTLRAEFTQTYVWGTRKRMESGTVCFALRGLMRWDYREPTRKLYISDGKKLSLYVPAENQVTRSSLKSSEDVRVPFRLILSRLDLHKVFSKIELVNPPPNRAPTSIVLRALPKRGQEEDYQEVQIELDPAFDIRRLVIFFNDRSTMEFTFDQIERDVALGPEFFHFTPPPGSEVIEQRDERH